MSEPIAVPDPTPVGAAAVDPPAAAAANGTAANAANTSAMYLFAPDPNAEGEKEPLDLDELFHDCYFGDFGVPEDVTSAAVTPAAIISAPAATAPVPVKRTAEQAGLSTPAAAPPAAPSAPEPTPLPPPGSSSSLATVLSGLNSSISTKPAASLTESQKIERRERNREHAKRSRLRKKFLLESLQEQIDGLQSEIHTLKDIIKRELPDKAADLLKDLDEGGEGSGDPNDPSQPKKGSYTPLPMPSGFGPVKTLMEPDYRLDRKSVV